MLSVQTYSTPYIVVEVIFSDFSSPILRPEKSVFEGGKS